MAYLLLNQNFLSNSIDPKKNLHLFVCLFQGWDGYRGLQQFLPLPEERVCIYRDPQSCEFPLHHYIGLVSNESADILRRPQNLK